MFKFEFLRPKEEPERPEYSRETFDAAEKEEGEARKERIQDRHRPMEMRDPKGVVRRDQEARTEKNRLSKEAREQALQEDVEKGKAAEDEVLAA